MAGKTKQPNILIIWGDDIGVHNVSAYNHGIMGGFWRLRHGLAQCGAKP